MNFCQACGVGRMELVGTKGNKEIFDCNVCERAVTRDKRNEEKQKMIKPVLCEEFGVTYAHSDMKEPGWVEFCSPPEI